MEKRNELFTAIIHRTKIHPATLLCLFLLQRVWYRGWISFRECKKLYVRLVSAAAVIAIAAMTFTNATTTLSIDTVAAYLDENKSDMTINGISLEHSEIYYNHGRIYIELD